VRRTVRRRRVSGKPGAIQCSETDLLDRAIVGEGLASLHGHDALRSMIAARSLAAQPGQGSPKSSTYTRDGLRGTLITQGRHRAVYLSEHARGAVGLQSR